MATRGLFSGGRSSRGNRNLVEFKAGKMYLSGKMCHADKRKGLVYAYRAEDALVHVCWKDRTSGVVQDDLIVFPGDAMLKHVKECTTGRVYVLVFKSSSKKLIFWMQEPKVEKDEENCRKLNAALNSPASADYHPTSSGFLASEGDLQTVLSSLTEEQLLRLLGNAGYGYMRTGSASSSASSSAPPSSNTQPTQPSRTPISAAGGSAQTSTRPAATEPLSSAGAEHQQQSVVTARAPVLLPSSSITGGPHDEMDISDDLRHPAGAVAPESTAVVKPSGTVLLSDLKNILSSLSGTMPLAVVCDLCEALTADCVVPMLADDTPALQQLVTLLPSYGNNWPPQGPDALTELRSTLSAPQFQQALSAFSSALSSGQLAPVISQFGLPQACQEAAYKGDVEKFVRVLQEHMQTCGSKRKADTGSS